ncbi:hypothetical protein BKK81_22645 [Cupriavidus sp. USMAHM13]|uniref:hypothetical protein n=1 Tax=Cupriavidus sp. USMAHM13 TaxID=1389192 RepID=UPI0008A714B3|nr:hypothetical protein [Cupriavidus sp. USMAHM13]AOZ02115.1 hypothetical protein BKK81_22645 [Cupriavidus sp. USMAHM13]
MSPADVKAGLPWPGSLSDLLALAALAPSSHNCQPWHVSLLHARGPSAIGGAGTPGRLVISIDRRRALDALPALRTEMSISVGGFAAILLNLLRMAGWPAEARWLTGAPEAHGVHLVPVVQIDLGARGVAACPAALRRLAAALRRRRTARGVYGGEVDFGALTGSDLLPHSLAGAAQAVPMRWQAVRHGERHSRLSAFYRRHAARDFVHRAAWRETYRHLVFSDAARAPHGTGINIQSLFGPMPAWRRQLHRVLLHPALLATLGPLGATARIGTHLEWLIRSSPTVLVLSSPATGATPGRDLLAGEAVVRLWLAAGEAGLSLHPLSVALQHPDLSELLGGLLGCADPLLFIARAGRPLQDGDPHHRYRRAPADFCSPPPGASVFPS